MDTKHRLRIELLALGLLALFGALLARCYYIQLLRHEHFRAIADRQHLVRVDELPLRGAIHDRNGILLAVTRLVPSICADPSAVTDPERTASRLALLLPVPRERLAELLSRSGRHFVWLARKVEPDVAERVLSLGLAGIGSRLEPKRGYPQGPVAAHVLGFCGTDGQGLEGVERGAERLLAGTPGARVQLRDGRRKAGLVHLPEALGTKARDGSDIHLTLDLVIQRIVEAELEAACAKYRPQRGMALVLQAGSGDILALAVRPTFDPNQFASVPPATWRNVVLADQYEPGSTIKPLVAAFGLEEALFTETTPVDCMNGRWRYRGRTLHDHHPYGTLTFTQVVVNSSNIGMAQIGLALGPQRLQRYLDAAGYGSAPEGLWFPGVAAGQLTPPDKWSYYTTTSVPMGHEILASPLQLAAGIHLLASGGIRAPCRLVHAVRPTDRPSPQLVPRGLLTEQVVSPETARTMRKILEQVVLEGTGKPAKLERYRVGGKTGTAQKVQPDGTYSHTRYLSSFVGFAPVEKPRVTVLVMLDEPADDGAGGTPYGGKVAGPPAARILERTLDYLGATS